MTTTPSTTMTEQQAINAITAFIAANPSAPGADVAAAAATRIAQSISDRRVAAEQAVREIG